MNAGNPYCRNNYDDDYYDDDDDDGDSSVCDNDVDDYSCNDNDDSNYIQKQIDHELDRQLEAMIAKNDWELKEELQCQIDNQTQTNLEYQLEDC